MTDQELKENQNMDALQLLIARRNRRFDKIKDGGGKKKIEKQHKQNKLTARERLAVLVDNEEEMLELGAFAGYEMYEAHGGCPAGGVITVVAKVSGRWCVIVANDATVKAGAWFPITGKKNLHVQELAMRYHLPVIYLVDSAGVYLPLQNEIFADKDHFGKTFYNNAQMSAMGIPQIAAIMGSCVAGGAYLPAMCDESLIVEGTGSIFLAGPYLVKAAIGEDVDKETLGGADTQTAISGVVDYKVPNDHACLEQIRKLIDQIGGNNTHENFDRKESVSPRFSEEDLLKHFPAERQKPYDTHKLIECIIDADSFVEYKSDYGQSIICGYARIDGWSVGIVANNREVTRNAKGEMKFGGVVYSDSADKAARFVMNCNQKKVPLVFLHDVTGFMVGSRSEHGGIIKDGAKLVSAVSNSIVPKFSIVMGNSYGAGNYAMCGRAYAPTFMWAWPTARIAVMGGAQAAKVLHQIEMASLRKSGKEPDEAQQQKVFDDLAQKYDEQTSPYYAAARLWVDDIIDPRATRSYISLGISATNHAPLGEFNVGVIQT